jgi:hypothetical protein
MHLMVEQDWVCFVRAHQARFDRRLALMKLVGFVRRRWLGIAMEAELASFGARADQTELASVGASGLAAGDAD